MHHTDDYLDPPKQFFPYYLKAREEAVRITGRELPVWSENPRRFLNALTKASITVSLVMPEYAGIDKQELEALLMLYERIEEYEKQFAILLHQELTAACERNEIIVKVTA